MNKKIISLCMMLALAGCSTYSLEELRQTTPKGNAFQNALADRYMHFAEDLEERYDWENSWHFADKGLLAAYGQEVGPEELSHWDIAEDVKPAMEKARADLLAALSPEAIEKQPEFAATAQYNFDCWVKNQHQNSRDEAITECREGFEDALAELMASKQAAETKTEHKAAEVSSYIVYFEWGQALLTGTAVKTVDGVADSLAEQDDYEILLNGHTDLSGDQKFNMKLSLKRAEAVKARLVARGVKADAIKLFAYGETDPNTPTKDGAKEKTNRRVEIFLHD